MAGTVTSRNRSGRGPESYFQFEALQYRHRATETLVLSSSLSALGRRRAQNGLTRTMGVAQAAVGFVRDELEKTVNMRSVECSACIPT
jgi:hypothetical protein